MSAEFKSGVIAATLGAHPQNVVFGYDVGKISAGCLVQLCVEFNTESSQPLFFNCFAIVVLEVSFT